ncbi:MAG: hypothetical protein U0807_06615 [Candidatus Binatia bacterium]
MIERPQRAHVDDLRLDAVVGEPRRRAQRLDGHVRGRDDRDVGPLARDPHRPDGDRVALRRDGAEDPVQPAVLEVDDRVVVLHRRDEEPFGVARRGRRDDLETREMREHRRQALRVLRPLAPAAPDDEPHDERHACAAAEHVVPLGGVVEELVEAEQREVDALVGENRAPADQRGADRDPGHRVLGRRHVHHSAAAVFRREAGGRAEDTLGIGDPEPEYVDARVARQALVGGLEHGLGEAQRPRHDAASA